MIISRQSRKENFVSSCRWPAQNPSQINRSGPEYEKAAECIRVDAWTRAAVMPVSPIVRVRVRPIASKSKLESRHQFRLRTCFQIDEGPRAEVIRYLEFGVAYRAST
jgi:hypothetical protein